jgi:hypothetical protein
MFTELCGGALIPYIKHPSADDRKLFFLFHYVHLLKCIRNSWLSQSDVLLNFTEDGIHVGRPCRCCVSYTIQRKIALFSRRQP